jgi:hypothetical protein
MYRVLPCVAVLSLALIAGCGGSDGGGTTTTTGKELSAANESNGSTSGDQSSTDADNPEVKAENAIADCMKQQGFKYVPFVEEYESSDSPRFRYAYASSLLEPEDKVRQWRKKYGFGLAAAVLFPNDSQVAPPKERVNPNKAITEALDPARLKAYNKALLGSEVKAGDLEAKDVPAQVKKHDKDVADYKKSCSGKQSVDDSAGQGNPAKTAANHRLVVKFKNDPAVESATEKYGTCMKGRGHKIAGLNSTPSSISEAAKNDGKGSGPQPVGEESAESYTKPTQRDLDKEVKVAPDDLECRSDYAKLVRSKYPTILTAFDGEGAG